MPKTHNNMILNGLVILKIFVYNIGGGRNEILFVETSVIVLS